MRHYTLILLCALPLAAGEWKGWLSDSSCGTANANASAASRDCAKRCIEGGSAPVLVTDGDQKVLKLAGKLDAKAHLQHKIKVTGELKGDTVHVTKVEKAD